MFLIFAAKNKNRTKFELWFYRKNIDTTKGRGTLCEGNIYHITDFTSILFVNIIEFSFGKILCILS